MKIAEASYGETIQVAEGHWKRFDTKVTGEGEAEDELFSEAKRIIKQQVAMETGMYTLSNDNHWQSITNSNKPTEIQIEKAPEHEEPFDLVKSIKSSGSVKVLETYRLMIKSNSDAEAAYNKRMKELQSQ